MCFSLMKSKQSSILCHEMLQVRHSMHEYCYNNRTGVLPVHLGSSLSYIHFVDNNVGLGEYIDEQCVVQILNSSGRYSGAHFLIE
jgi:hypothetical protein